MISSFYHSISTSLIIYLMFTMLTRLKVINFNLWKLPQNLSDMLIVINIVFIIIFNLKTLHSVVKLLRYILHTHNFALNSNEKIFISFKFKNVSSFCYYSLSQYYLLSKRNFVITKTRDAICNWIRYEVSQSFEQFLLAHLRGIEYLTSTLYCFQRTKQIFYQHHQHNQWKTRSTYISFTILTEICIIYYHKNCVINYSNN